MAATVFLEQTVFMCVLPYFSLRLRIQHESLQQVEREQAEFIEDFGLK